MKRCFGLFEHGRSSYISFVWETSLFKGESLYSVGSVTSLSGYCGNVDSGFTYSWTPLYHLNSRTSVQGTADWP